MRLTGKVALVTGAGSGIGEGIAKRFADEGAHVIVNYRPGGSYADAANALAESLPTESIAVAADVSKRADVEALVAEAVAKFGKLDVAVSNAGVGITKPFLDVTDEDWRTVLDVNLFGSFLVAQVAARQMVKQGHGGKLIFVSSVHEDIPFANSAAYCASKGGMRMLMRTLALELAPHRINCNNIAPGAIVTPINKKLVSDAVERTNAIGEIPWGRLGLPEDVAAVAAFLASGDADYVTGSTYYVDGGMTQQVTKY
jgi:glucose 1-dehydrogenase